MNTGRKISRRDFVKLCGALSLAVSAPVSLVPLAEAQARSDRFEQTRLKMGTLVTITVTADSSDQALAACETAWAEMDRLIAVFDRHRQGTAVSELNNAGRLSDPGPELLDVLALAARTHQVSRGAFDPTVLPLLTLIQESFHKTNRPPDQAELAEAFKMVDFGRVRFGPSGAAMGLAGQKLSLDGIAKGYIVDRAALALRKAGIKSALINAGGDILALGGKDDRRPWRIAVQDPFQPNKHLRIIALADQAVATSGSYEIFFDKEHKFHHLLNPADGRPATRLVAATTTAPTAAQADAASTAAFIAPETLKSLPAVEGLIVARNGGQALTSGFKSLLVRS